MEQQHRLEQNRYPKPFVGLSTAEEASSFIAGNNKEKPSTCVVFTKVENYGKKKLKRHTKSKCLRGLSACIRSPNDRKLLKTNIYFGRAQRTLTTSLSAPTGPPNKTQKAVFMKVWQRRLGPKFKKNKLT